MTFDYTDKAGVLSSRRVEPYELVPGGDGVYAFDLDKNSIRHFKLNQIGNIVKTDETFEPRFPVKLLPAS